MSRLAASPAPPHQALEPRAVDFAAFAAGCDTPWHCTTSTLAPRNGVDRRRRAAATKGGRMAPFSSTTIAESQKCMMISPPANTVWFLFGAIPCVGLPLNAMPSIER